MWWKWVGSLSKKRLFFNLICAIMIKKILIIWAWSIGIRIWAELHHAWHAVTLVGRQKLYSLWSFVKLNWIKYALPEKAKEITYWGWSHYDFVFITSKLYDFQSIVREIEESQVSYQYLAVIQNGLVNDDFYWSLIHTGKLTSISIYEWHRMVANDISFYHSKNTPWQVNNSDAWKVVRDLLSDTWIWCVVSDDINSQRAKKLLINSVTNWLCAIHKMSIWDVLLEKRWEMESLLEEWYEILNKAYNLPWYDELKKETFEILARNKSHFPTTYEDVINGNQTEIDYINGFIITLGKQLWIATPHNQKVYDAVIDLFTD